MGEHQCSGFKEPESLKDALEFVDMLHTNATVTNKIIGNIKLKVEEYFGLGMGYLFDGGSKSSFGFVLQLLAELRQKLLKDNSYETYKDCKLETQQECIATYVSCLLNNIYDIFGSVYYLYFMCYPESRTYGGGDWSSIKGENTEGNNLQKWLTDEKTSSVTLKLKGDFDADKLNEKISQDGTSDINNTLRMLIGFQVGGMLQFPLEHMLFLGNWSDAKTAYALLFLDVFCDMVNKGLAYTVKDDNLSPVTGISMTQTDDTIRPETIKSQCKSLSSSIKKVTQQIGAGTIDSHNTYGYLRYEEKFSIYLKWLKINLNDLINSLNFMASDIQKWTKDALNASESCGPFAFGFCFRDNTWHSDSLLNSQLSNDIHSITGQLQSLQYKIRPKESNDPDASSIEDPSERASSVSRAEESSDDTKENPSGSSKDERSESITQGSTSHKQEISKGNSSPSGNSIATASAVVGGVIGLGGLVTYGAASGHLGKAALGVFTAISSLLH